MGIIPRLQLNALTAIADGLLDLINVALGLIPAPLVVGDGNNAPCFGGDIIIRSGTGCCIGVAGEGDLIGFAGAAYNGLLQELLNLRGVGGILGPLLILLLFPDILLFLCNIRAVKFKERKEP